MKTIIPILIIFFVSVIVGQDSREKQYRMNEKGLAEAVSQTPAQREILGQNGKIIAFPSKFIGDNVSDIVNLLSGEGSPIVKDEFETQQEYDIRLGKFFRETKLNGKPLFDTVFVIKPECNYLAEVQTFACSATSFENVPENITNPDPTVPTRLNFENSKDDLKIFYAINSIKGREITNNLRMAIYGLPIKADSYFVTIKISKYFLFNDTSGEIYVQKEITDVPETSKPGRLSPTTEWIELARKRDLKTGFVVYYRPGIVTDILGDHETWLKVILNQPEIVGKTLRARKSIVSRLMYARAHCSQQKLTLSNISNFDAAGKMVSYVENDWSNYFEPVTPGSIGEHIVNTLCN